MYITFRYDLIQHLVGKVGEFKSEYDTPAKQSLLLKHIATLHSHTMMFVVLADDLYCVYLINYMNIFSDSVESFRKHIR